MADIAFDIIGRDRASAAFSKVGKAAATADKQTSSFGDTLKSKLGKAAALTGVGLGASAIVGFAKSAIDTEAKFSTSMRLIQASSGATGAQMKQLNDLAVDLGAKTVYSANEAADAMLELSKAGISTGDIMSGAAKGTLLLASAGGTSLTTAATIASNAMNAFNLKGKDMGKIASALAGGANASSASVESLGQGLAQVGPGARNAGLSLQETVAALSAFDAAGIKGSDAGTSLKTMLTRLIPNTTKASTEMERLGLFSKKTGSAFVNADGSFKNLTQISGLLHDKLSKLSDAERAQALSIIFGSDATRAATVLMNDGAGGIRKYLKATQDQNAAQKMANAAMGGTRGAIESLNGAIDTAKLRLGQALAPAVIKVADGLSTNMVPAMDGAISVAEDLGRGLNGTVIPPLRMLGDVVGEVAKFLGGLPAPIKSVGIEAGIAALVFPRLAAGAAAATTAIKDQITYLRVIRLEMTETATRGELVSTAMGKLASASKMAAGVGGMVALTESSKHANTNLGMLVKAAGGAALGFSVAGPWGALIGGGVGLVSGLAAKLHAAKEAVRHYQDQLSHTDAIRGFIKDNKDLRDGLDKVTGAITNETGAFLKDKLIKSGALPALNQYHISTRALIQAILGNKDALRQVQPGFENMSRQIRAYDKEFAGVSKTIREFNATPTAQRQDFLEAHGFSSITELQEWGQHLIELRNDLVTARATLPGFTQDLKNNQKQIRKDAFDTRDYGQALRAAGFGKKLISQIQVNGIKQSASGVASVIEKFHIARKTGNITALIKASGWQVTNQHVQEVIAKLKEADKTKASLRAFQQSITSGMDDTKGKARVKVEDLAKAIGVPIEKMKPDMRTFLTTVATSLSNEKAPAGRGAGQIASFIIAGLRNGLSSQSGIIGSEAAAIVNNAIARMRAAAKVKSPSRRTLELGKNLGDGMRLGLRASEKGIGKAGVSLLESLVDGIDKHKVKLKDVLGKLTGYIQQESGKISDLLGKKAGVVQSLQGFSSSVFGATFTDSEGNERKGTIDDLIAYQKQQRNKAMTLKRDVAKLLKAGLSRSLIQQLISAGPEGEANIHTLAESSAQQIAQINALNAQTNTALTGAGNALGGSLYNDALADERKNKALAVAMANEFRKTLAEHKHDHMTVEVVIDGHRLHTVLLKEKQKQGKGLNLG